MVNVNDYKGSSDIDQILSAIADKQADGIVMIPPRSSANEPERDFWLIDRAILLPENTTVLLQNCKIKLSDQCRDNFFRTANCGFGIPFPQKISNVHIHGEGLCILEGADHPRSTGDGGKILANPCPYELEDLCKFADWIPAEQRTSDAVTFANRHDHTYGTDAGKEGESQYGDWRNVGILFANTENFSIKNVQLTDYHGWGISLEACTHGRVENIHLDACMSKMIDGLRNNIENQDGIDVRNGCHHIIISDVTGQTGDDVVALTAIANEGFTPGGSLATTHVMHNDWSKRERGIHDIIIRNVIAHSHLCYNIRLLACHSKIRNVIADGIVDTAPDDLLHSGSFVIGEPDFVFGTNDPDSISDVTISNVISNARDVIKVKGYLKNAIISNVINKRNDTPIVVALREDGLNNVIVQNTITK